MLAQIVGSADIVGQMADRTYLEKLLFLYLEFKEAQFGNYASMLDLLRQTKSFYDQTKEEKLEGTFDGVYKKLTFHFKDYVGMESNYYVECIEKNIAYLSKVITLNEVEFLTMLKRGGIVDKSQKPGIRTLGLVQLSIVWFPALGNRTHMRPCCFMRPACAPAFSPNPQKNQRAPSPDCAARILRQHQPIKRRCTIGLGGGEEYGGAKRDSARINRNAVLIGERHTQRTYRRAEMFRQFAEEHIAGIHLQQRHQLCRILFSPCFDACMEASSSFISPSR